MVWSRFARRAGVIIAGLALAIVPVSASTAREQAGVPAHSLSAQAPVGLPAQSAIKPAAQIAAPAASYSISRCGLTSGRVLLTFDDWAYGDPYRAVRVGKYLQQKHIRAAFFLINENAQHYPDIVRQLRQQGHWVGNHTYSHPDLTTLSKAGVKWQIQHGLGGTGSASSHELRPPYGAYLPHPGHPAIVGPVASSLGYRICTWTVDTVDWKKTAGHYRSVSAIRATVRNTSTTWLKNGVILGHLFTNYPDALSGIIADVHAKELLFCLNTGAVPAAMPAHPNCAG